jgi:Reverse transcriptase (RNA-dependent DNA polymerase)
MPTSVLKDVADLASPYVAHLFNCSISVGNLPSKFKRTFITPILKKPGLDAKDVGSYRPIANLSVLFKVIERVAACLLTDYIKEAGLLITLQSCFRPLHSTETAVLKVLSDLLQIIDRVDNRVLVLLDVLAAFDTVDHDILLQRLESTFGISGEVLAWLSSYLSGREQLAAACASGSFGSEPGRVH